MKKRKIFFLLAFFALFLCSPEMALAAAEPPILSVNGEGRAQAAPDQAIVTFSVTSHAADGKAAQRENAAASSALRDAIKAMGIEDKDIQTRDYSFHPTYGQAPGREKEIDGYLARNSIVVTINDITKVGQVIDTALARGANQVSSLEFRLRKEGNLRREALTAAIRDARDKANILAGGLGKRIVGLKSVSESTGSAGQRSYSMAMLAKNSAAEESTPIEAGTLVLEATVHIDYLLDD